MKKPQKTRKSKKNNQTLPLFLLIGLLLFLALIIESVRVFWLAPHVFVGKEDKISSKKTPIKDVFNEIEKLYPNYKHPAELLLREKVAVFPHNPLMGKASAPITLVVFSDSNCQKCRAEVNNILGLIKPYLPKTKVVFKFMSTDNNVGDMDGGLFEQIAWKYGVFQPYMAMVMQSNKQLQTHDYVNFLEKLGVSLDVQKKIITEQTAPIFANLQLDIEQAKRLKISNKFIPPVFYLNGYRLEQENLPKQNIVQYIKRLLAGEKIVPEEK